MRWEGQALRATEDGALPGLGLAGLVRSVRTPEFAGVTFHEVVAKSALNKVPRASSMPFRWTVNPMRGCSHACTYCFARPTHTYLDLGVGEDFERQIVVKTNVVDVLRGELARPSWRGERVALGTNTDPYQRAEGRYRLMPGIIDALTSAGTPLSMLDEDLQQSLEPGTPTPRARLDLVRAVRASGLRCTVFVAPVMPWLTDSVEQLDALLGQVARAGATGASVIPLHLRGPVKPLVLGWLAAEHPALVGRYRRLYGSGAYVGKEYATWLRSRADPLRARHGLRHGPGRGGVWSTWVSSDGSVDARGAASQGVQPELF